MTVAPPGIVQLPVPGCRGYHQRFNRSRFVKKIVLPRAPDTNTAVALVAKF
jgi:hypothetical protein